MFTPLWFYKQSNALNNLYVKKYLNKKTPTQKNKRFHPDIKTEKMKNVVINNVVYVM